MVSEGTLVMMVDPNGEPFVARVDLVSTLTKLSSEPGWEAAGPHSPAALMQRFGDSCPVVIFQVVDRPGMCFACLVYDGRYVDVNGNEEKLAVVHGPPGDC